jgi:hypothetical protein
MYGLTPGEAAMLIGGNCVVHMAQVLRSSVATVRAHLQRIFGMTGARRLTNLVTLVSSSCRVSKNQMRFRRDPEYTQTGPR